MVRSLFRRDRTSSEVDRILLRYLELRVAELEQAAAAELESKRQSATRTAVGQMITWLLLFVAYSVALGLASASILNETLYNPALLTDRLRTVLRYAGETSGAVPDPIRGILLAAPSALALLIFRSASFNVPSDIGGALFVGLTVVSLVGLSSAALSGALGLLVALPGVVAAIAVVYELLVTLQRLSRQSEPAEPATGKRVLDWLATVSDSIHPRRTPFMSVLFAGLPLLFVLFVLGSYFTKGGPLWWPSRLSMYGLGAWSLWGCLVTPRVARIALWSTVPWGGLVRLQLAISDAAVIFGLAVGLVLYFNAVLAVLRAPAPTDRPVDALPEKPALQPG